jgi:hypothetical protein
MTPKILKLIESCGGCPNRKYYSAGAYQCSLVDQTIADDSKVAPFCPLADFPSQRIANLDSTVRLLREPHKYGLVFAIVAHVAVKLNTTVSDRGVVTIALKDGTSIMLFPDHILSANPMKGGEIEFLYEGVKYKIYPDVLHGPELEKEVTIPELPEKGPQWVRVKLA